MADHLVDCPERHDDHPGSRFSLNQHLTLKGHFGALKYSPTLRFIFFGAVMYTLASLQGSLEALRSLNAVTHLTHFTVAHAHLGMYGFVTMVILRSASISSCRACWICNGHRRV